MLKVDSCASMMENGVNGSRGVTVSANRTEDLDTLAPRGESLSHRIISASLGGKPAVGAGGPRMVDLFKDIEIQTLTGEQ
jgi:hypothetical protein